MPQAFLTTYETDFNDMEICQITLLRFPATVPVTLGFAEIAFESLSCHLPMKTGRLRDDVYFHHAPPLPVPLLATPKAFGASCVGGEGEEARAD